MEGPVESEDADVVGAVVSNYLLGHVAAGEQSFFIYHAVDIVDL